jgi:hypothetical protein
MPARGAVADMPDPMLRASPSASSAPEGIQHAGMVRTAQAAAISAAGPSGAWSGLFYRRKSESTIVSSSERIRQDVIGM